MEQLLNLPVPQLEPIQHLGDYLDGLNACEALEGLNQLADRVLVQADESYNYTTHYLREHSHNNSTSNYKNNQQQQQCQYTTIQQANCFRFGAYEDQRQQLCDTVAMGHRLPMSPPSDLDSSSSRCSSAQNSSQWLSSNSSSPAPSDLHQFASSRSSTCSAWSLASSSGPASVASSIGEQLADNCIIQEHLLPLAGSAESMSSRSSCKSSRSSRSSRSFSSSSTSSVSSSRRLRNATAAERYRRRQKGRKCGLVEELEVERERNEQLRRELDAKLTLYREFVALLARQTTETDLELAKLGHQSLVSVLEAISSAPQLNLAQETPIQRELRAHLTHFQSLLKLQIASTKTTPTTSNKSLTTCSVQSDRSSAHKYQLQQQQQQQAAAIVQPQLEQYCPRPAFCQPIAFVGATTGGSGRHHQQLEYDFYADRFVPLIGA